MTQESVPADRQGMEVDQSLKWYRICVQPHKPEMFLIIRFIEAANGYSALEIAKQQLGMDDLLRFGSLHVDEYKELLDEIPPKRKNFLPKLRRKQN